MGVVTEGGVANQGVGAVFTGVVHNGLGAQACLQLSKGLQCQRRKRPLFPFGIFSCESC